MWMHVVLNMADGRKIDGLWCGETPEEAALKAVAAYDYQPEAVATATVNDKEVSLRSRRP